MPGGAEDRRTVGHAIAEEWYEPLAGEPPQSLHAPAMDIAFATLLYRVLPHSERAEQVAPDLVMLALRALKLKRPKESSQLRNLHRWNLRQ